MLGNGVSSHYVGEDGRLYFEWQNQSAELGGEIESHKFSRWVGQSDVVVDFGCGGGYLLRALHCARRVGVEPNRYARDHAVGIGIECYESLEAVPDQMADVGITNHALEHVLFPVEALRQLKSLKGKGRWENTDLHTNGRLAHPPTVRSTGYQSPFMFVECSGVWEHAPGMWI